MKGIIVQARLGSTRLPGKILKPFYGDKSILDLLIEKLKRVDNDLEIVIATSIAQENDGLEIIASKYNIKCYRGSENDVLDRFVQAAKKFSISEIIRVCSDNPFLELRSIKELVSFVDSITQKKDYVSYSISGTPSIKTHYGFWTEYVSLNTLEKVAEMTKEPIYREHVTNFIYSHPEEFDIEWIEGPNEINREIRLTIDTELDFKTAQTIYSALCQSNPYPNIEDVVEYLDRNPSYYEIMKKQIMINSK